MQEITTLDWTEVTGLSADTTYTIQASTKNYVANNVEADRTPIHCYWADQATAPTDLETGIIASGIKKKVINKIFVKVGKVPAIINVQEV